MTVATPAANEQPVTHHRIRNTVIAICSVLVFGLAAAGGYWVWTQKDSGTQIRATVKETVVSAADRTKEIGGQLIGKTPETNAAAAPAPAGQQQATPSALSKSEAEQLNSLLLKQAVNVLPPPNNGNVGVMVQTAKLGTPPSKECRQLVDTKHDPATKGTIQTWKRC